MGIEKKCALFFSVGNELIVGVNLVGQANQIYGKHKERGEVRSPPIIFKSDMTPEEILGAFSKIVTGSISIRTYDNKGNAASLHYSNQNEQYANVLAGVFGAYFGNLAMPKKSEFDGMPP